MSTVIPFETVQSLQSNQISLEQVPFLEIEYFIGSLEDLSIY